MRRQAEMTLAERAQLATLASQRKAVGRAVRLCWLLDEGVGLKRAAHRVGWSYRSATRWKRRMEGAR